jgi:hypothetical protein
MIANSQRHRGRPIRLHYGKSASAARNALCLSSGDKTENENTQLSSVIPTVFLLKWPPRTFLRVSYSEIPQQGQKAPNMPDVIYWHLS